MKLFHGMPGYIANSIFDEPAGSGRAAELYLALARSRFASLPGELSTADLRMLERYLFARLELEREERRMHFGALALLSLLFFVLLPHLISGEFQSVALDLLALLLLTLIVPYIFVYFGYENRVRAMGAARLRALEKLLAAVGD